MPPDRPSARASSVAREVADGLVGYRAEAAVLVSSHACGDSMGEEWGRMQSAALGLGDESFEETCRTALGLYGLAANGVHCITCSTSDRSGWCATHENLAVWLTAEKPTAES